nr:FecR domain-containing protein [Agrobacterium salinitolerans]
MLSLEDGSRISLNTDTAIAVHYSQKERRITLLRGEAYFDVAKNPERPFVVEDGALTAKALGTHYSVRTGNGALPQEVQVEEGRVEVTTGAETAVLTPGEAVTLGGDGRLVRAARMSPTAWPGAKESSSFPASRCARFSIFSRNIAGAASSSSMRRRRGSTFPASSTSGTRIRRSPFSKKAFPFRYRGFPECWFSSARDKITFFADPTSGVGPPFHSSQSGPVSAGA